MNEHDIETLKYHRLKECLITLTKDYPLQTHDYMIIEDKDFKGKILDIGCGPGKLAIVAKLINPNLNITGWDGSIINIEIAKTLALKAGVSNITFTQYILNQPSDEKFDVIVLNHVLEHLPNIDLAFKEIEKLIVPGGIIYVAVPYKDCHYSPDHKYFFSVKDNDTCYINPKIKCFNINKWLRQSTYDYNILIFDEEKIDKRHPFKSNGQLDMFIKIETR